MRLKVIRKWPIRRKTLLFCTLLFFPFKFLQQSPVSAGIRSPPHIRFDYFFPLGLRARDRTGHKIERFFHLGKGLIGDNFEKKNRTADCRFVETLYPTQHRLAHQKG